MKTFTKPEQIQQWELDMFMVNTLAFQLEKWADIPPNVPLKKESREALKHLRNKCRKLNEINGVRPLSGLEEDFYEVGDEFHAIMGHIQQANRTNTPFAFSMLSICTALATENVEELQEFWHKLGVYISQLKVAKK
jgi:hypothetical protein